MTEEYEQFLADISRCFIERSLVGWQSRLLLPFSVVTKNGPVVLPNKTAVAQNFALYLVACDAMQLDMIDRNAVSLEDCKDGTFLGTFTTRLISLGQLATAPYTSTALLRFDKKRLKMSSLLNGRGHQEWSGVHDK